MGRRREIVLLLLLVLAGCFHDEDSVTIPITEYPGGPIIEIPDPERYGSPHPKVVSVPTSCCNHPYFHNITRAHSDDGETWTKDTDFLIEHASVPEIIRKADDTYILYYVNGSIDTFDCSISEDGDAFSYGNCTIYDFSVDQAWDPDVTEIGSRIYRLFFFAPGGRGDNRIMSATSSDGSDWVMDGEVWFEYPAILDPSVIGIGGEQWMYTWYEDSGPIIVSAIRGDDRTFEFFEELDLGGSVPDIYETEPGVYSMYFCKDGISVVTSEDGSTWSESTLLLEPGEGEIICDPTVAETDDGWVMYYKVQATS